MSFIYLNGLQVETGTFTGNAGQAIDSNFRTIATREGNVYSGTTNPTANNDSADSAHLGTSFSQYSRWFNTSTKVLYVCVDPTPTAAVWQQDSGAPYSLPDATTTIIGGVNVPAAGGLAVATGALSANVDGSTVVINGSDEIAVGDIAASQVNSGTFAAARLPLATTSTIGGAEFPAAGGLAVSSGSVSANVDGSTVVINGSNEIAVGSIAASAIGSGTLNAARLPNPTASTLGGVESLAAVSHNFLTSISTSGVPAQAQPAFSDLSGSATTAQLPTATTSALGVAEFPAAGGLAVSTGSVSANVDGSTVVINGSNQIAVGSIAGSAIGSGTVPAARLPNPTAGTLGGVESIAAVSHNFLTSISTSGVPAQAQPAFTDISGSVAAAQLPNPSASTLGGVESIAAVSHNFLTSISTSGVPAQAQPAFTDISGTASAAQGGTGVGGGSAANGSLLIGNGSGYSLATLTAGSNITVTNGSGTITIAASGGGGSSPTVTATSSTTATPTVNEILEVHTASNACAVTLPAPSSNSGQSVWIVDIDGSANTNNITVKPNASEKIGFLSVNYIMVVPYAAMQFYTNGTDWRIIS